MRRRAGAGTAKAEAPLRRRCGGDTVWRWGPVAAWLLVISALSSGWFSGPQTAYFLIPVIRWLFPSATWADLLAAHPQITGIFARSNSSSCAFVGPRQRPTNRLMPAALNRGAFEGFCSQTASGNQFSSTGGPFFQSPDAGRPAERAGSSEGSAAA